MGLRISTNTQSLTAERNLATATKANDESLERLSSGMRINRASDDAAGLAISEKMKSDIKSLNMAKRNANDGVSLLQTAEGGMNEIGNILTRLRELSIQGASDTIGNKERGFIQKEVNALKDEVDRITYSTEYNGTTLLPGKSDNGVLKGLNANANEAPLEIQVGKSWNKASDSKDASGEFEHNPINIIRANFDKIDTSTGEKGLNLGKSTDGGVDSVGVFVEGDSNKSKLRAQQSLSTLDDAISKVASYRSELGAVQSRLNSTITNLAVQSENFSAANSRIRDTDFASETAKLTQSNILKQGGVSVLSQANQNPSSALALLR